MLVGIVILYMYNKTYNLRCLMDAISYTAARQNLAKTMDRVCSDHEPIIITRNNEQSVVMISLASGWFGIAVPKRCRSRLGK